MNTSKKTQTGNSVLVNKLTEILKISREEILGSFNTKLVDFGIDSLQISILQNLLDSSPSLLELYNLTLQNISDLWQNNGTESVAYEKKTIETKQLKFLEMQESYYIGRFESDRFLPCQVYSEFDFDQIDIPAFNQAIHYVIEKHPMLRAHIVDDQYQEIRDVEEFNVSFSGIRVERSEINLEKRRFECMNSFKKEPNCFWKIEATILPEGKTRLHVLLDMIFLDAASSFLVIRDLVYAYNNIQNGSFIKSVDDNGLSFFEYCTNIQSSSESAASRKYWHDRLDSMPGPPQLPRVQFEKTVLEPSFERISLALDSTKWRALKMRAQELQITPTALILTAFSEVLRTYSDEPNFTLTITITNRHVGGKNFSEVVGDFTNVLLLSILECSNFQDKVKKVHTDMANALNHKDMSGLKVMRLLREKMSNPSFILPIVFTSLLGIDVMPFIDINGLVPCLVYQQTMTPQVWLDHQVYEIGPNDGKELRINWDYDSMFYSPVLIKEMMEAYRLLLESLSQDTWPKETIEVALPASVQNLRFEINATKRDFGNNLLLHTRFETSAVQFSENIAVIDQEVQFTYKKLDQMVSAAMAVLKKNNVKQGDLVGVVMEKGWEQIVAILGILRAGAAYLPINPSDPDLRISTILKLAETPVVLSHSKVMNTGRNWKSSEDQIIIQISIASLEDVKDTETKLIHVDPDSLAYIIFTSGTEGTPKGVEITHRGAMNTCLDINERLGLSANDSVFSISSLSFDLSVWDIFGILSVGGKVVICKSDATRDPEYWWSQLQKHQITIWNSVPTSFEMLIETIPVNNESGSVQFLKSIMLSGDAIKMDFVRLVKQVHPTVRILCLGGATEASIWSNIHEIFPCKSPKGYLVPYGVPLSNQTMHILDERGLYRPANVLGEIYIGGIGLARGYFRNSEKTSEKFINHRVLGRLYNTGDVGYYLSNGEIQIVGRRRDAQIKIGGYRVELTEIENCAEQVNCVKKVAVIFVPGSVQRLIGFVEVDDGIPEDQVKQELIDRIVSCLPDYMWTRTWIVLNSMPLNSNGKIDRVILATLVPNQVPISTKTESLQRNELEIKILRIAQELLNDSQQSLKTTTSLIEFGMTSLTAIRFSKNLSDEINKKLPYTLVFNHPTVKQIAEMITGHPIDSLRKRQNFSSEPRERSISHNVSIAVIGMACRLPGGVSSAEEFWTMLMEKRNCVTEVPSSRFDINEIYSPNPKTIGKSYTKKGAFINDVEWFDNDFFNIPLAEARTMDPQQRLILEVAYEAFLNAGLDKSALKDSNTGVFIGQMNYDWMLVTDSPHSYAGTGNSPSITANRISFALGLHGASMTVDTACSSSLVAVDLAIEKLRNKKCSVALAGGVNIILHPEPYLITCAAEMLSVDSRCATFDSKANGIVRGEGIGCVVLKCLDQAVFDGDKIFAVIKGSAVNQDGRSATLTAPNGIAQEAALCSALEDAGIDGKDLDYVECHGTGTDLGDPIEVEALAKVLGKERSKPIVLGAVKTNIGHLEGAAGIVGLIKTVLVLQNGQAPPNIHFEKLNPKIDLQQLKGIIPTQTIKIGTDGGKELFAGVSSFGFGGTNAHIILQSYPQKQNTERIASIGPTFVNKKCIPWKLPVPIQSISSHKVEQDEISGSVYEIKWIPLNEISNNEASLNNLIKSRCLILSVESVSTNGTKWVNIIHAVNSNFFTLEDTLQQKRSANLHDTKYLEKLLVNESWSSIILVATSGHGQIVFEIGVRLLKAIQKSYIEKNQQSIPDIWFLDDSQFDEMGLWALARTARIEMPELDLRCVEYNKLNTASHIAELCYKVRKEVKNGEKELKLSNMFYVRRLVKLSQTYKNIRQRVIHENCTYVISGGLGALGLVVAEWLVNSGATHIVLLSRKMKATNPIEQIRRQKENISIEWIQCDISNIEEVKRVDKKLKIDMRWPVIKGIFHTAGELFDSTVKNLEPKCIYSSFSAKVDGAKHLHTVLSPSDFMVLFSSITGVFGSAGQALYSAANAALDSLAESWSNNGNLKVLSIQWGAWSEVGMAARSKDLIQRLENQGFGSISNSFGKRVLERLLEENRTGTVCVQPINWSRMSPISHLPLLDQLRSTSVSKSNESKQSKTYANVDEIRAVLRSIVHEVLGNEVEESIPLMDAGLSSLEMVSLHHTLAREFTNINIPSSIIFNYPTIKDLADFIFTQLEQSTKKKRESSTEEYTGQDWQKLNLTTNGRSVFLVGGVLGTAEGTFGKLANMLPSPVYATIPDLSDENATVENIAKKLIRSARRIQPDGKYIVGGLSFGALIALEMVCQLEQFDQVEALLLLDPRHTPPFTIPEKNPAKFEKLVAAYTPKAIVHSRTVLVQAVLPDFSGLSSLLQEASRSFQGNEQVELNCRSWCSKISKIPSEGHHFKFLNQNHEALARALTSLSINWKMEKIDNIKHEDDPIAVISMSCRFPGGASNPEDFWDILIRGHDCVTEVPISRFDMDDDVYYPERGYEGKSYSNRAAFIENVEWFDHEFFNISRAEALIMDPQQRILLEVAYEAFYKAGYNKERLKGCNAGVFVGQANYDWMTSNEDVDFSSPYYGAGSSASITANRISYTLGLEGPSITMDTACSSSLVALDIAHSKLRDGKCSIALVAGVNLILNSRFFVTASAMQALSLKGRCATFDALADGYCRGEGVGCVILKPLSQAKADGNKILALIKGTAVNHDGRSASLTAPNGLAQQKVIRKGLEMAGLKGKDIDYIECHGTGTKLGDPIEVDALKNVLSEGRKKPIILGALKTNTGHLEGAAGIAGFIKAVLVIQHKKVPPNIHINELNPKIDLTGFNAIIPYKEVLFENDVLNAYSEEDEKPLIGAVSSFGFGGTNAHVIIESWETKEEHLETAQSKNLILFNPKFLPWRRLTHPLIYRKEETNDKKTCFISRLSGERSHLWDDHVINNEIWIPAASHLTMLAGAKLEKENRESIATSKVSKVVQLDDVIIQKRLLVKENMKIRCVLEENGKGEIQTEDSDGAKETNVIVTQISLVAQTSLPNPLQLDVLKSQCSVSMDVDSIYKTFESLGVKFGDTFRTVIEAWRGKDEALARVGIARRVLAPWERSLSLLHPAILDGAFQLMGMSALSSSGVFVPFHVQRAVFSTQNEQEDQWVYVQLKQMTSSSLTADVILMNSSGKITGFVENLTSRRLSSLEISPIECLYQTEWSTVSLRSDLVVTKRSELSRCVLISFAPISFDHKNWLNVIHNQNSTISPVEKNYRVVDLRIEIGNILNQEKWDSIIFIANGEDSFLALEFGLLLLKEIQNRIISGQWNQTDLWFITKSLIHSTTNDDLLGSSVAGLWALARTARIEMSELKLKCIEIEQDINSSGQISNICNVVESFEDENEFQLSYNGLLKVLRLVKLNNLSPEMKTSQQLKINPGETHVISGGLGALGLVIAKWLIDSGATHILLLSRTRKTEMSIELNSLKEKETAVIEWVQCDVSEKESVTSVRKVLEESLKWPPVTGIFHTAGVLADGTIRTLDSEALRKSYSAKVYGAINLHNVFSSFNFMVLFSSAAAVFGSPGQANYSAANATMDAIAKSWNRSGESILSIQWGAWSEAGMAANRGTLRRIEMQGFGGISNHLGIEILEYLFSTGKVGVVCATPIDWSRMSLTNNPLVSFKGKDKQISKKKKSQTVSIPTEDVKQKLIKIAVEVLNAEKIDENVSLIEFGLDSLGAVEFRNLLVAEINIELPSIFVYNHPSISDMVSYLSSLSSPKIVEFAPTQFSNEPIAVISMACRFPGEAHNPEEFWSMLRNGHNCVTEVPFSRFDIDEFYDPVRGSMGKTYTKNAALINSIEWFDNEFFNIPSAEAIVMDPQQRVLLEVSYEAFSRAGYDKSSLKGSNTGVFVGQANYDWMTMNQHDITSPYFGAGSSAAITSNRLSFILGLRGPSMTIDTACSSSLVAMDIATANLRSDKCSLALVAGVNIILSHVNFVGSCSANMLSAKGRCATFDSTADGYCRGEGVGCVVLKKLSRAQADGDEILAIIKGTAVNQDGRSATMTAPSGVAQESVIRRALVEAGVFGKDIDYVECHGTGTELGDPIEVEALKSVLNVEREKRLILGAVKSNIGHLEGAAGIAGFIKTVLVLRNKMVPPNIHFETLNPKINIENFNIDIPITNTDLRITNPSRKVIAGISSFGFGGTNAHIIIESWETKEEHLETAQSKNLILFNPKFLPWRRLTHPLIYRKEETNDKKTCFISRLSGERSHLWDDHVINNEIWIPAASHLTMLAGAKLEKENRESIATSKVSKVVQLDDVIIQKRLLVKENMKIRCVLEENGKGEIQTEDSDGAKETNVIVTQISLVAQTSLPNPLQLDVLKSQCSVSMDVDSIYKTFESLGVKFGDTFRTVIEAWRGKDEALARVGIARRVLAPWERSLSLLHPAILDGAFQLMGMSALSSSGVFVPFHVQRAVFSTQNEQEDQWVYVQLKQMTSSSLTADVILMNSSGKITGFVENLTSRRLSSLEISPIECLYQTEWSTVSLRSDLVVTKRSELSRCVLISFAPISFDHKNWLNVIHNQNSTISPVEKNYRVVDLRIEIGNILNQEKWDSIIFIANGEDSFLALEFGLLLLKEIQNRIISGQWNQTDLWFITKSLIHSTTNDDLLGSSVAGLWALARTARIEMSELKLKCIEIEQDINSSGQISNICNVVESFEDENEFQLSYNGLLKVLRLVKLNNLSPEMKTSQQLKINPGETHVISGGLGALGLVIAKWLIDSGATHILLLSRTRKTEMSIELNSLKEKETAVIEWVQCDVSEKESVTSVRKVLEESLKWPPVTGIFHTAGVLADGTIRTLDSEALRKSYSAKVYGAINLHNVFSSFNFMVLFSSAAAVFGSPGQANYSAANATMDAIAKSWNRSGESILSIQWGAWSEAGMAANRGTLRRIEMQGFGGISNHLGIEILEYLFSTGKVGVVCAAPIDWTRIDNYYNPFLEYYRSHLAISRTKIANTVKKVTIDNVDIMNILTQVSMEVLGSKIDENSSLVTSGLDSLGAVEFRNRLSAILDIQLSSIFVYNYPTLAEMASALSTKDSKVSSTIKKERQIESVTDSIAVIGMACRLPGGVASPEEFWSMLIQECDCVTEIPKTRFDIEDVYSPIRGVTTGKSYTKHGAFMSDLEWFDAACFNISNSEARQMDPQQRLILEVGYEAFVRAGYDISKLKGLDAGVFVGQMNYDWMMMNAGTPPSYGGTGMAPSITANRFSYTFGLTGPSFTIDSACSSSLVALDYAIEKIRANRCSLALVGGVNVMLQSMNFVGSSAANMLSPAGRCATFDETADGYCRGEGIGCVVLKSFRKAIADGDNVLAVIKGSAVNHVGKSSSLTAPNGPSQEAVIRNALEQANLKGKDVDYVECHGTGTQLGDPIEVEALKNVLNDGGRIKSVILGAVKTNIGHLEGAAGIIGLIKTVLVLQHEEVPSNLHFKKLNANIDLTGFKAIFPQNCIKLDTHEKNQVHSERRWIAGVSSFGFGGTNAHVVLESWPAARVLRDSAVELEVDRNFVWLFTGQGSQFSGMGQELYQSEEAFRMALDICAEHLNNLIDVPLLTLMFNPDMESRLNETRYSQAAILSFEYAMSEMWKNRGVTPKIVLGHSIGEYTAAVVSGVMKLKDALSLVTARGRLMDERCQKGSMVAVFALADTIRSELKLVDDVSISALNGPKMTVLSGKKESLQSLLARLKLPHTFLPVKHGFHSHLMHPMQAEFQKNFENVALNSPRKDITFVSTVTGTILVGKELMNTDYWVNQVAQPVNFFDAMNAITSYTKDMEVSYIEIGPKQILIPMAKRFVTVNTYTWDPSNDTRVKTIKDKTITQNNRTTNLQNLFNKKHLPWKVKDAKYNEETVDSVNENYFYEIEWETLIYTEARNIIGKLPRYLIFSHHYLSVTSSDGTYVIHTDETSGNHGHENKNITWLDLSDKDNVKTILMRDEWEAILLFGHGEETLQTIQIALTVLQNSQLQKLKHVWFITSDNEKGEALRALARTARQEIYSVRIWSLEFLYRTSNMNFAKVYETISCTRKQEDYDFRLTGNFEVQVPRLVHMKPYSEINSKPFEIHPYTTYVISGGLGALGLVAAKWIIDSGATNLVLLSRKKPNHIANEKLELLQQSGKVFIECFECDVGDLNSVKKVHLNLKELQWPPVKGVIHSAGVLFDSTISNLDQEKLVNSFKPKVLGAANLRSVFLPLDFFVQFSSVASVFGSAGQANYAISNAVMDGMAMTWKNQGEPVLSIQWAAWSDGGMAVHNKTALKRSERIGFGNISNKLGTAVLDKLFAEGRLGVVCVAPADWSRAIPHLKTTLVERLNQQNKNAMNEKLNFESSEIKNKNVISLIRQVAEDVIGTEIQDDQALLEAGMDSLGAVEFRNQLSEKLNIPLSTGILFDFPTVHTLANHLESIVQIPAVQQQIVVPLSFPSSGRPTLIIGAGLGGLSFARMLVQAKEKVIIMESKSEIGGVWKLWANSSSKLQIDSPSYDFGCSDSRELKTWPSTYPNRDDVLKGAQDMVSTFAGENVSILMNTHVDRVHSVLGHSSEYLIDYTINGKPSQMRVGGVAAFTGGLHEPRQLNIPGENIFKGKLGFGTNDDITPATFENSRVVILGHGAFAVENMRTALENGAEHVTILCRKRNMVFSTFCNWLLNSCEGNMSIKTVMEVMRPMYQAAGVDIEALSCFSSENGDFMFDQDTVPPASDLYFLAQATGRLEVIQDIPESLEQDEVVTRGGRRIRANILLKCLGFNTNDALVKEIFGSDCNIQGLWVNEDPNIFVYNDGVQRSRAVHSLLCSSYLFFAQTFASVYLHFKRRPNDLRSALVKMRQVSETETHGRLMVLLWDFLSPAKRTLSERTLRICPFNTFIREREVEWNKYQQVLKLSSKLNLHSLLKPTIDEIRRREPVKLLEERSIFANKSTSIYRSKPKYRILFLHGQGTDGAIACNLLERCGWITQFSNCLEFIVPDAPYEMPAFTNKQQLSEIGLDTLVEQRLYNLNSNYREWRADFDWFAQIFHGNKALLISDTENEKIKQSWKQNFEYIRHITEKYGQFDGLAGFCEGASVASVALHLQALFNKGNQDGIDLGLVNVCFLIAMSPWRSPYFEMQQLFNHESPLDVPSLHISGQNDMEMFKQAVPIFMNDFLNPRRYEHNGKHEYPVVTPSLKNIVSELLNQL